MLLSVEPLVRQVPVPTRRHLAPASRAYDGLIVTLNDPVCCTYVTVVVAVCPPLTVTARLDGLFHPKTRLNSTV